MRIFDKFASGAALAAVFAVCALDARAQVFQELYSFTGLADGLTPQGALIQGKDGNFYGTTLYGPGPITEDWLGYGTVFRMTPQGVLTTIFVFNWTNGAYPSGALLQAADGHFYGTTSSGWGGRGTVFKLTVDGELTTLAWFGGGLGFGAGADPLGDLVQGPDWKLYGVTRAGGCNNSGTIFRISTNGNIENLHLFCGDDGLSPSGGLLLAGDGNFYGVTAGGGWCNGNGTIYRVTTNGTLTTVASFCQGAGNAVWPRGKLLQAEDGNFYGAAGGGVGTFFKMTPGNALTTFARISAGCYGDDPVGGLIQANDGYIYGSTYQGGSNYSLGTVFRMDPTRGCTDHTWNFCSNLTSLVLFGDNASGAYPYAGLVPGSDRNLYGTTAFGGSHGAGIIFRIVMPGPLLSSTRADRDLVLSWRTNYTGYFLQSSTDLNRGRWTDCTNTVSTISGQYFVTNSISGSPRFFRLSKISQP